MHKITALLLLFIFTGCTQTTPVAVENTTELYEKNTSMTEEISMTDEESTDVSTPREPGAYTMEEVAQNNSKDSCWVVIRDKVYDLTSLIAVHPGGDTPILRICGRDGTAVFEGQHGGSTMQEEQLETMYIGNLKK